MITAEDLIAKAQIYVNSISNRVEPSDWFEFFTESIRELRRGRTLPEQRRPLTMDFFTNVFQYKLQDDFDSFIKPHLSMFEASDEGPYLVYGRDKDFFASNKYGLALTNETTGKYLLARINGQSDICIDNFNDADTTSYTLTGDGSNLLINNYNYKENNQSLQFDITDVTHASILNKTLPSATDLTDMVKFGSTAFLYVYMPTVITSIKMRLLSSTGNYYQTLPVTTNFYGQAFQVGWNLIAMPLQTKTTVGTPDVTMIANYELEINNTGVSGSGFLFDALYLRIPTKMELPYNSKNLVLDADGVTYKETVVAETDTILCDNTFEAVIMYNSTWHAATWKYNDKDLADNAMAKLRQSMIEFNRRYPLTEAPIQSNYYRHNKF